MTPPKPSIYFHYTDGRFHLAERKRLKAFLFNLFLLERTQVQELHYVFCSDASLLELNKSFLQHNTYTDILTFVLSEPNDPIISDIYISIARVRENATLLNKTFTDEIHRVIFHGALHLCGYTDKTLAQKKHMRKKEDFYLTQFFVPHNTVSLRNNSNV